jgi:hypothetical protein
MVIQSSLLASPKKLHYSALLQSLSNVTQKGATLDVGETFQCLLNSDGAGEDRVFVFPCSFKLTVTSVLSPRNVSRLLRAQECLWCFLVCCPPWSSRFLSSRQLSVRIAAKCTTGLRKCLTGCEPRIVRFIAGNWRKEKSIDFIIKESKFRDVTNL